LAALDLNADGRIDLFATRNNDSVLVQLARPDRRK
jgi:hypothetical protein